MGDIDGLVVLGAFVVGVLVGLREPVGTCEMLGEFNGEPVVDGDNVVGASVGCAVVGVKVGFEHPAVFCTSATTASLHCPLISVYATQKNAPPLHVNSALLNVLRSDMTWTAWAALAFDPVGPQSEMQKPKITLEG